jgi:hypothetical protein
MLVLIELLKDNIKYSHNCENKKPGGKEYVISSNTINLCLKNVTNKEEHWGLAHAFYLYSIPGGRDMKDHVSKPACSKI